MFFEGMRRDWSRVDITALPALTEPARHLLDELEQLARTESWIPATRQVNIRTLRVRRRRKRAGREGRANDAPGEHRGRRRTGDCYRRSPPRRNDRIMMIRATAARAAASQRITCRQ
jgi:hypothetical protein